MKLSDYIAEFLSNITKHVFVGQGGCVVHILDSIENRGDIKIIPSQNEQCAAIAADAYSRTDNNYGVSIATSGPGMLNLMQGIACSYFDSIPTMHFSGAVVTSQLRKDKKLRQLGFQEMEVVDLVTPITKYAVLLKDKNRIKYELQKMLYMSLEGRPGPVLMDLPDDLQRAEIDPKKLISFVPPAKKYMSSNTMQSSINEVIKLIKESSRPLIIIGNGIKLSKTEKELKKFIKKTKIPFIPTWATLDIFNYNNKLHAGTFGVAATRYGNFAIQNSDLLIILGSRLNTQHTGSNVSSFAPKAKKIMVDIDSAELNKNNGLLLDIKINLDLKIFFEKMFSKIKKINNKNYNNWIKNFAIWKSKYPIFESSYSRKKNISPYYFMKTLSEMTKKNDILIPDASANLIWAMQSFHLCKSQKVFTALNHSPMGYSMPATIGSYFANSKKRVICTIGDGSLQMNMQELATIAHFKLPIKIFVINNGGYGLIKQTQDTWLRSRRVGVDKKSGLAMPNIQSIAKSYDIKVCEISNSKDLKSKIAYVLNSKKPILCDVKILASEKVIPKLESGRAIHDLSPLLSKKELEKNLSI